MVGMVISLFWIILLTGVFRNQNKWIGINQLLTIAIIHHERPDEIIANTVGII